MKVTQVQLKIIAFGLIPVFFILSAILPDNLTTTIILALVVITAVAVISIGWRMETREAAGNTDDDLLALPPKTPKK